MFRPVCPRSALSQLNCIWVRKTSIDGEISIIDFLGVEFRKYRERESKKKRISWLIRIASMTMHHQVVSWMQFFHCSTTPGSLLPLSQPAKQPSRTQQPYIRRG